MPIPTSRPHRAPPLRILAAAVLTAATATACTHWWPRPPRTSTTTSTTLPHDAETVTIDVSLFTFWVDPAHLTAYVRTVDGQPVTTGQVEFHQGRPDDDYRVLATAPLDDTGRASATYQFPCCTAGVPAFAVYTGAPGYLPSTSAVTSYDIAPYDPPWPPKPTTTTTTATTPTTVP
jgi:hypothetical protein